MLEIFSDFFCSHLLRAKDISNCEFIPVNLINQGKPGLLNMSALNQGNAGTCVVYALARSIQKAMLTKYAKLLITDEIVTLIKNACPSWTGNRIDAVCEEFNLQQMQRNYWFEDSERKCRYKIRLDSSAPINTIDETYNKAQSVQGVLYIMASIKLPEGGNHAVAIDHPHKSSNRLRAINSWGTNQPHIEVNLQNFNYAVLVDVTIVAVRTGNTEQSIPHTSLSYQELALPLPQVVIARQQVENVTQQLELAQAQSELRFRALQATNTAIKQQLEFVKQQLVARNYELHVLFNLHQQNKQARQQSNNAQSQYLQYPQYQEQQRQQQEHHHHQQQHHHQHQQQHHHQHQQQHTFAPPPQPRQRQQQQQEQYNQQNQQQQHNQQNYPQIVSFNLIP